MNALPISFADCLFRFARSIRRFGSVCGLVLAGLHPAEGTLRDLDTDRDYGGAVDVLYNRIGDREGQSGWINFGWGIEYILSYYVNVGHERNSTGTMRVSDPGTIVRSTLLYAGERGKGYVIVKDGASLLVNTHTYIGFDYTSYGELTVRDPGSMWHTQANVAVGKDATGHVFVLDGGYASTRGDVTVGNITNFKPEPDSSVTISGAGSLWVATALFSVGHNSSARMTISDGGMLQTKYSYIGYNVSTLSGYYGSSEVDVTGAGSRWELLDDLYVGNGHKGTLRIQDGGQVISTGVAIGGQVSGTVLVSGEDSLLETRGNLLLGNMAGGAGHMTIEDGGTVRVRGTMERRVGDIDSDEPETALSGATVSVNSGGTLDVQDLRMSHMLYLDLNQGGTLRVHDMDARAGAFTHNGGHLDVTGQLQTNGYAGSGTIALQGSQALWQDTSRLYLGNQRDSVGNLLQVSGGAKINSASARIGNEPGAQAKATLTGANSRWENSGAFRVGYAGTGVLEVLNGAQMVSGESQVGAVSGSRGSVLVDGAAAGHANWKLNGVLSVGRSGFGELDITRGGSVDSAESHVGFASGSEGVVRINDRGTWNVSNTASIGTSGYGRVLIDSSEWNSVTTYVGRNNGARGEVDIVNGRWDVTGSLIAGGSSLNTATTATGHVRLNDSQLTVSDTLKLHSGGTLLLGAGSFASLNHLDVAGGTLNFSGGRMEVSGRATGDFDIAAGELQLLSEGASLERQSQLRVGVGNGRSGTLAADGGSVIRSAGGRIGVDSGSYGTVSLSDGSSWFNNDFLRVGYAGTGTLGLRNNSTLVSGNSQLGALGGSTGVVRVESGSQWTAADSLAVGQSGRGELYISGGGTVNSETLYVGRNANGEGYISVRDQESALNVSGSAIIGADTADAGATGWGYVLVTNGGRMSVSDTLTLHRQGRIGIAEGGLLRVHHLDAMAGTVSLENGTIEVTGNLSSAMDIASGSLVLDGDQAHWERSGVLNIGMDSPRRNDGLLVLKGGAQLGSGTAFIGLNSGINGVARVSGAGSLWNADALRVGFDGKGALEVLSGGQVAASGALVGVNTGSEGIVRVNGAGGKSRWNLSNALTLGQSGSGTLEVADGGEVRSGSAYLGRYNGSLGKAGVRGSGSSWHITGNLVLGGSTLSEASNSVGVLTIADGGLVSVSGNAKLHAGGSINLENGGRFEVQNFDARDGTFLFSGGTLRVGGTYTGDLHIGADGLFTGSSRVAGNLHNSGTVAPGNSPGLLTIDGDYTQDADATLQMEIGGTTRGAGYDGIDVGGWITLAGNLELLQYGEYVPGLGDTFTLFNAAGITGTFERLSLFALLDGLAWDLSGLYTAGVISVVNAVPEPAALALILCVVLTVLLGSRRSALRLLTA